MILTKKEQVAPPEIFEIISIPLHTAWEDFLVMFHGYTGVFPIFYRKLFFQNSIRHFDRPEILKIHFFDSDFGRSKYRFLAF